MTTQTEKDFTRLVIQAFARKENDRIMAIKDFCLTHFSNQLHTFQQQMLTSQTLCYEKETLLINNNIEVVVSGWLPGNTCYPHDNDQAECFVFVLNGQMENTCMRFENGELETTGKTAKQNGDHIYLPNGTIHYMQNTGNEVLICLHIYTPGISEMKVYDEGTKTVYTVTGEGTAWLPADPNQVLEVRAFEENAVDWLIY